MSRPASSVTDLQPTGHGILKVENLVLPGYKSNHTSEP